MTLHPSISFEKREKKKVRISTSLLDTQSALQRANDMQNLFCKSYVDRTYSMRRVVSYLLLLLLSRANEEIFFEHLRVIEYDHDNSNNNR